MNYIVHVLSQSPGQDMEAMIDYFVHTLPQYPGRHVKHGNNDILHRAKFASISRTTHRKEMMDYILHILPQSPGQHIGRGNNHG